MQIASRSAKSNFSLQPVPSASDKLAAQIAPVDQKSGEVNKLELLLIKIGEEFFAIRALQVLRLFRASTLQPPTQTEPHPALVGFIEGAALPVFDLGKLLNLELQAPTNTDQVLIIEHKMRVIGLRVSTVNEIIRASDTELAPLPSIIEANRERPIAWALLFSHDKTVVLIEPYELLTEREWQTHAVVL
jgi:chemotaxis signal transduction protein